ncbi:MAG: NYN domain-containing protein [Parvibaculales bacterium]
MIKFYPNERFAVFIDSANFRRSKQSINMYVDDVKLLDYFRKNNGESIFLRIYHYESIPREDGSEDRADLVHRIHRRLDFMAYNGFTVVSKPSKDIIDASGEAVLKGNMDGEMIVDMMAISESLDHIVVFSGDGDFRYAIEKLQERGKRVTVVSSEGSIANELKRQADTYIDLEELRPFIESTHESVRQVEEA